MDMIIITIYGNDHRNRRDHHYQIWKPRYATMLNMVIPDMEISIYGNFLIWKVRSNREGCRSYYGQTTHTWITWLIMNKTVWNSRNSGTAEYLGNFLTVYVYKELFFCK